MKTEILIFTLISLYLTSCVDRYKPDLEKAPKNIVIEGMVTNQPGHYTVTVTNLKNVYDRFADSVSAAKVWVDDNLGNIYPFTEKTRGVYLSDSNTFRGIIGNTYTLHVETKEGKKYISSPETMPDNPTVKNVTSTYKNDTPEKEGFYIDIEIEDVPNQKNFYRWETTYYPLKWICGEVGTSQGTFSIPCCNLCWFIKKKPNNIILSSDELYENSSAVVKEIFVIPYDSRSNANFTIKQYSYSERVYEFWNQVRKQISNVGSIFDPTPFTIKGNISNPNDSKENVLGIFSAASVKYIPQNIKRDYITDNPKVVFPPPFAPPPTKCIPCKDEVDIVTTKKPLGWPF